MKRITFALSAMAAFGMAGAANAQQFVTQPDIIGTPGDGTPYIGPGVEGLSGSGVGAVNDGGFDAFDQFGGYENLGGLGFDRQTEVFGNTYRFFDTFTNNTGATVSRTLRFTGDLGSDSATAFLTNTPGISVTCQFTGGSCRSDPVVALTYSNNGMGTLSFGPGYNGPQDRLFVDFMVTLAAGQSLSLVNFAFLARDINGTNAGDVALANATALSLQANPNYTGLTNAQVARIVNFGAAAPGPVPEPATWAMMLAGFGALGIAMRRRRVATRVRFA